MPDNICLSLKKSQIKSGNIMNEKIIGLNITECIESKLEKKGNISVNEAANISGYTLLWAGDNPGQALC